MFEKELAERLRKFSILAQKKVIGIDKVVKGGAVTICLNELTSEYSELKYLIHESLMRAYGAQKADKGLTISRSRALPDTVIFAGMPISLYKSKKLVCPGFVSITYGWMRFLTNALFNNPPLWLRKFINGLERHNSVDEPSYPHKDAIYMKNFEIFNEMEFKQLKAYLNDLTKDPQNSIPLLIANQSGQYINYYLKRIRQIPKLFMYGEKDAIASGSFVGELLSRVNLNDSKKANREAIEYVVKSISIKEEIKIYKDIGHTLDERKGSLKKLSRRHQNIAIQNDIVEFMKKSL